MKFSEAIEKAGEEFWFRPVSWRNTGTAYAVIDGYVMIVPFISYSVASFPKAKCLLADWEVLSPEDVISEL